MRGKMISLKRNIKKKNTKTPECVQMDEEKYPYGWRIHMNKEEIEKLGLDINKLDIGQKSTMKANIEIIGLSANKGQRPEDSHKTIELQITDVDLGMPKAKKNKFSKYSEKQSDFGGVLD